MLNEVFLKTFHWKDKTEAKWWSMTQNKQQCMALLYTKGKKTVTNFKMFPNSEV